MYEDHELERMRWEIIRPCEAIVRQLKVSTGEKQDLGDRYLEIDQVRNQLHKVVWEIHRGSLWDKPYTVAYNAVDEAAQDISIARDADDKVTYLEKTVQHLERAVDALMTGG